MGLTLPKVLTPVSAQASPHFGNFFKSEVFTNSSGADTCLRSSLAAS
jgi:hypothetical protein